MIFPNGGPIPRHPSQLYEAALEGVVLFVVLGLMVRCGALKRPGVVTGSFALGYGVARIICELFREPDVAARLSLGRADHGHAAVHSADARRHRHSHFRADATNRNRKMADDDAPLESEIRRLIAVAGPMPVADYMRLCLSHPQHGYYINRDPLGARGDFITAPEISQMFGELIGMWLAAVWQQMGAPENVRLIELGPGRGTLMLDALRAARVVKGFREAIVLHLVEISPALQKLQQQRLEALDVPALWHATLEDVPGGPSLIIANEFIDALPVHQAVKQADGWHERVVEIGADGNLVLRPGARSAAAFRDRPAARLAAVARRLDLRMALRQDRARARPARAHRRRGADRRLRSRQVRPGRYIAGRRRTRLRRSVACAGRGRPHRARRFRGAGAERRKHRRPHSRSDPAARACCFGSASTSAQPRSRPTPRATRRWRSSWRCRA